MLGDVAIAAIRIVVHHDIAGLEEGFAQFLQGPAQGVIDGAHHGRREILLRDEVSVPVEEHANAGLDALSDPMADAADVLKGLVRADSIGETHLIDCSARARQLELLAGDPVDRMENAEAGARRGKVGERLGSGFENDAAIALSIDRCDNLQPATGGLVMGAVADAKSAVSLIAFETGNLRCRRFPARTAHYEGNRPQGLMSG